MTNETKQATKKKAPPVERAYKKGADGKPDFSKEVPIWGSKHGKAKNFTITEPGEYVIFVKTEAANDQPAAEGKGA